MPRSFGEGLKYFQVDVDLYDNDKIDILRDHFDDSAVSFWIFLHGMIFENGYYLEITERFVNKFCKKVLRKTPEQFYEMLEFSIAIKIFDKTCYNEYKVLTSRGIQTRYLFMGRRWERIKLIEEYMLDRVDYEDSIITIYNRSGQHIGYKKKQGELIKAEFPSRAHKKKEAESSPEQPQTPLQPSKQFDPPVVSHEEKIRPEHFRDMEMEELAANFFNYNEIKNYDKVTLFTHFLTAINLRGELDEFREQFPAYIEYKRVSGEKTSHFESFIGDQRERFANGKWKKENWLALLEKELSKPVKQNGSHKEPTSKADQAIASHDNYVRKRTGI